MITFGIFMGYLLGYGFRNRTGSFRGPDFYCILFYFPILISIVQIFLFVFKYPNETPTFLMMNNKGKEAMALVNQMYFQLEMDDENSEDYFGDSQLQINDKNMTYKELFNSVKLTESLKMGCIISILQQLSGINYIIMYSTNIFYTEYSTLIIGAINCASGSVSIFMLKKHYKKNLQFGSLGMCGCYILIIIFSCFSDLFKHVQLPIMIAFILCFEFSIGPIMWIYCADVLSDKGLAVASTLN